MKLTGNNEWIAIGALILYIAFTPGFPVVRQLLSSGIGKALGLGLIVYVWKFVSEPVALLLLVNFVRCASMREYMTNPNTHCPSPFTLTPEGDACKDASGNSGPPPTICLPGQTWNGTICAGASTATTAGTTPPPPAVGPTGNSVTTTSSSTGSTGTIQRFTNMGGVQPNSKDTTGFAPA